MSVSDAIGHAAATSGAAVAFAGSTVIIALLALAVSGIGLVAMLGQAAAIVVPVALLVVADLGGTQTSRSDGLRLVALRNRLERTRAYRP